MKKKLEIKCPAKVNLSLDVLNRRDDGYHNLKMIMCTVGLCDVLNITAERCEKTKITASSNRAYIPSDDRNLCVKAARLFLEYTGISAKIHIDIKKRIPVGAGLGGGSSDAAGTLSVINRILGMPCTAEQLADIAKNVGADVPFFVYGGCMLAEGIGEKLSPLPMPKDIWIVIAKPSFGISTPFIYKNLVLDDKTLHPDTEMTIAALKKGDMQLLGQAAGNVLEAPAIAHYPQLGEYKRLMKNCGAVYSLMSGSGSAVFGVFKDGASAQKCVTKFKKVTRQVYKIKM